jgi:hypothetical protein
MDFNQNYVNQMKEWLNERKIRIDECQNSIDAAKRLIESNHKQIELHKECYNAAVKEFNEWALENGFETIKLLP